MEQRLIELRNDLLNEIKELLVNKHNGCFYFSANAGVTKFIEDDLNEVVCKYNAALMEILDGGTLAISYRGEDLPDEYMYLRHESTDNLLKIYNIVKGY